MICAQQLNSTMMFSKLNRHDADILVVIFTNILFERVDYEQRLFEISATKELSIFKVYIELSWTCYYTQKYECCPMSRIECTEVTDSLPYICTGDADNLQKNIHTISLIEILPEARCH